MASESALLESDNPLTKDDTLIDSDDTLIDSNDSLPLTSSHGDSITVKCGTTVGSLYLDKLSAVSNPSAFKSTKCILSNSTWYSPGEFESLGGKVKSKHWKRSIFYGNVQLGTYLASIGLDTPPKTSTTPSRGSSPVPSLVDSSISGQLRSPILAFIKAYRLRGVASGLRNAVLSVFDSTSLVAAHKLLWELTSFIFLRLSWILCLRELKTITMLSLVWPLKWSICLLQSLPTYRIHLTNAVPLYPLL